MRFEPENIDDANAGLSMVRDMLLPVKVVWPWNGDTEIWKRGIVDRSIDRMTAALNSRL